MDLLPHVCVGRPGARVSASHASVADRCEKHGDHSDQNRRYDVPVRLLLYNAEERHRRGRLNENDADEYEIAQTERATQVPAAARLRVVHLP